MPTTAERRNRSLIKVAEKTGIFQENGEYWDGKERREKDLPKEKGEKKDSTLKKSIAPVDFFG